MIGILNFLIFNQISY